MLPRRFALVRHVDYTGVSGVGVVAYGVVFADGHVALRWASSNPATSLWGSLDDLVAVHGHGDATSIEWLDPASDPLARPTPSRGAGRRARRVQPDPVPEPVVEPDVTQPTRPIMLDPEPAPAAPQPSAAPQAPAAPQVPAAPPVPAAAPTPEPPVSPSIATPTEAALPPPPPADPVNSHNGGRPAHSRLPAQRGTGRHRRRATDPPRTTYQIESDGP